MYTFKDNKFLKADARESLLGNLTIPVISMFLYTTTTVMLSDLISNFGSSSLLLSLILTVAVFLVVNTCSGMLRIGLSCMFLRLQFGGKAVMGDLLYAFRNNSNTAVIISAFLSVLELLCMLPAILFTAFIPEQSVPGNLFLYIILVAAGALGAIAIRIRYAICAYLFLDFPDYTAGELIRGGTKLMNGHLRRLYSLYLSFLPMYLLTLLSFGIAGLWVSSYTHAAEAAFYKDLMAGINQ